MGVVEYAKNLAASIPQNNGSSMIPSLIGAAGSIIGGGLGFLGQQSANKTNLQIARETNAANRANQEYQNEWNLEMWNKQNEYNSPASQRQRLEAAGLNPIMTGLDGVSQAGELQSADYVATPGAPMLNSGEFLGNGISNAMKTMAEIKLLDAQAKKTDNEAGLTGIEKQIKEATKGSLITLGNLQVPMTQSIIDMNDAQRKVFAQNIEESQTRIADYNSQISTRSRQMDLAESIAQVDKEFKEAQTRIAQQHVDNETEKNANDLLVALKGLEISMYEAQTHRKQFNLEDAKWAKYLEKEYGLDCSIKQGQLSLMAVERDGKLEQVAETHLKAIKLVKDITYGEGSMGQAAFMLDHVITNSGLAGNLAGNVSRHLTQFRNDVNSNANSNKAIWQQ